jgi:hypothetical protein
MTWVLSKCMLYFNKKFTYPEKTFNQLKHRLWKNSEMAESHNTLKESESRTLFMT